jgi:hypothetical protein
MERKVRKTVEGFLEALGRPRLSPWVAEVLEEWKWRGNWRADTGGEGMRVTVELKRDRWDFRLPVPPGIPHFTIEKWGENGVKVNNPYLEARDERAFFMACGESAALSETLALARGLGPLFQALGLGDLEEALVALGDLDAGAKTHGAYVLVSDPKRGVLALRRGGLFGDPELDKAFLSWARRRSSPTPRERWRCWEESPRPTPWSSRGSGSGGGTRSFRQGAGFSRSRWRTTSSVSTPSCLSSSGKRRRRPWRRSPRRPSP